MFFSQIFFCKNTRIIFYKRAKVSASPVLCWFFILHWDSCRLSVCYYSGTDIYHCAENQWCTLLYLEGDNCGFSAFQVVPKTFANVFTNRNLQIYSKRYLQKYEQEYLHLFCTGIIVVSATQQAITINWTGDVGFLFSLFRVFIQISF